MDRKEKIMEIAKQVFQSRYPVAMEELSKVYMANKKQILDDFLMRVVPLVTLAKQQQTHGIKGEIRYVMISFLQSSFITKSYQFYFSLTDESNYLDPTDTSMCWRPEFIFLTLGEDLACLNKAVSRELIRVKPYELDAVKRAYICQGYAAAAGMFFAETAADVFEKAGIRELWLSDELQFLFGGYMDQMIAFASLKKEQVS